jgi:hypothetical protein
LNTIGAMSFEGEMSHAFKDTKVLDDNLRK